MLTGKPRGRVHPANTQPSEPAWGEVQSKALQMKDGDMSTIFTQIIRGELPSEMVFETEHEVAFLDIHPSSDGHTLVVPRLEVSAFDHLPPESVASLAQTVQVVAQGVTRAMGTPHYNLALNNGAPAGQVVFHVHFHVIPRFGGRPRVGGTGEGLPEIGERIRRALQELGHPTPHPR